MDPQNKHQDDELLDRLLKEYLLEEGNDPAVKQSVDILSENVFEQEHVLEPGSAREKTLEKLHSGKNGAGTGLSGTVIFGVLLLILLISAILFFIPSDKKEPTTASNSSTPTDEPPTEQVAAPVHPVENMTLARQSEETSIQETETRASVHTTPQNEVPPPPPVEEDNTPVDFKWLQDKLARVGENLPKDKLYLRSDKSLYKTGERVWLAVYVRDEATLQKSKMSEVVYVHLINPKNQVEKSIRLIARDGIASGDFLLEDNLIGGIYKLKTYTNWQKNDSKAKSFEKEIQVQQLIGSDISLKLDFEKEQFTKDEKIKATVKFQNTKGEPVKDFTFQCVVTLADEQKLEFEKTTNNEGKAFLEFKFPDKEDIRKGFLNFYFEYNGNKEFLSEQIPVHSALKFQLFPEGGDLVAGISSRIAYQAMSETGAPLEVKGDVMDDNGRKILSFNSTAQGRGSFELKPEAGRTYTAFVKGDQVSTSLSLPEAQNKGYVLRVNDITKEHAELTIRSLANAEVLLSAILRDRLCYNNTHQLVPGDNVVKIPVFNLPMGILQITLFDKHGIPCAERLVFINSHKKLDITLTAAQNSFAQHQKIKLDLITKDEHDITQPVQLTVSAINEQLITDKGSHNGIFSTLFLTPELNAGNRNNECYFHEEKDCSAEELDLLMLTKGWRRFSWESIAEPANPNPHTNERAIVAGRILDPVNSRPMQGVEITLPGSEPVITDAQGHFSFNTINLENKAEMTLAYGKDKMSYYISEYDEKLEIIFYGDGKEIYQPEEKGVRNPFVKALKRASAESAIVLGKVVGRDYEPLSNATIKLMLGTEVIATTSSDINGFYQIETTNVGVFDVVVSHQNFREHSYTAHKIEKGKALLLDMLLSDEKLPGNLNEKAGATASLNSSYPLKVPALRTTELSLASGVDFNKVLQGFSETYHLDETGNLYLKEFKDKNNVYVDGLNLEYNKAVSILKDNIEQISIYNEEGAPSKQDGTTDCIIEIKTTGSTEPSADTKELFISRYYRAKEFPHIYYNSNKKEPVGNDFRTTLYWNPTLETNAEGNASVEFYSSDVPGTYKVIVEGISTNGKVGYGEFLFEVKE